MDKRTVYKKAEDRREQARQVHEQLDEDFDREGLPRWLIDLALALKS